MKHYRIVLAIVCLAGLSAGPASAQNLLTNPGFATDLSGWDAASGTTWDGTRDANGSPGSGSARVADTLWIANRTCHSPISQCVSVTPGTAYDLSGKIFIPSGQSVSGAGHYYAYWYSGANCSGVPTVGPNTTTVESSSQTNAWFQVSANNNIAPSGNVSAYVAANVCEDAAGTFVANYDDVFFGPHPAAAATAVPTLGPWALSILALGVLVLAASALRFRGTA